MINVPCGFDMYGIGKLQAIKDRPESMSTSFAQTTPPRNAKFKVILKNLTKG